MLTPMRHASTFARALLSQLIWTRRSTRDLTVSLEFEIADILRLLFQKQEEGADSQSFKTLCKSA
ncbi:hypothetical protein CDL60_27925 [Roseateles noduli]|nr:hypothetical protein CDL60_27925 [Roseateles noduli]